MRNNLRMRFTSLSLDHFLSVKKRRYVLDRFNINLRFFWYGALPVLVLAV